MTYSLLLEQTMNGIVAGSMYALMGAGVALVYGTMRVMNFAHGEFFMVGGYGLYVGMIGLHLPPVLATLVAVAAVAIVAGAVELALINPLTAQNGWELSTIVTTLGLSLVLQSLALRFIGEEYYSLPYFLDGSIGLGGLQLSYQRMLILAVAVVTLMLMELFLRKSQTGWALRAVSQDAEAASVVGVPAKKMFFVAFVLSGILSGVAAVMLSPIQSVNPWMGAAMGLKAFVIVVLGGMGSFGGTIVAGFLVGIVESVGTSLTSSEWRELFSFGMLILVIWFKPEGLFVRVGRKA